MKAGELNRRILIQRPTTNTTDAFGQPVTIWVDQASVAAKATPISDGERWKAGEVAAAITHRFVIRYGGVLPRPTDRIVFEGRTYDVTGIKEVGFHEGWEITAGARAE
jgi:SPP1 family predicted phage head-tail adaptor